MREDYINEEVKKGNQDVRTRLGRIDMLPPPSKEEVFNLIEAKDKGRDRSRSKSKSKSPGPEARGGAPPRQALPSFSDRKNSKSRLDLFAADADAQSNYSGKVQRLLNNPSSQAALRNDDFFEK